MKPHLPWTAWLVATLATFGVLEYRAYRLRKGLTLTATIRLVLVTHPKRKRGNLGTAVLLGLLGYLAIHILSVLDPDSPKGSQQ